MQRYDECTRSNQYKEPREHRHKDATPEQALARNAIHSPRRKEHKREQHGKRNQSAVVAAPFGDACCPECQERTGGNCNHIGQTRQHAAVSDRYRSTSMSGRMHRLFFAEASIAADTMQLIPAGMNGFVEMTPGTSCNRFASYRKHGLLLNRTGFYLRDERGVSVIATITYIRSLLNRPPPRLQISSHASQ